LERSGAKWSQLLSISSRFRHVLKFRDLINKPPGQFEVGIGVQHGPFTYYDEEGKKIYSGEYKDGEVDWVEEY